MKIQRSYACAAILAIACAMPAIAMAQEKASKKEIQELQKQLNDLREQMSRIQTRLDQLSTVTAPSIPEDGTIETSHPAIQGPASGHVGKETSEYQEFSEDNEAAARFDNVPLDPKYRGFFRLPDTQTILKIGGYVKADFIHDLKPAGDPDEFIPSSIPVPQAAVVSNTNISVRPTRLNLDFRIPSTKLGEARFYVEGDFFGVNEFSLRMRHAYAQAGNILFGQTFTNFMDPDAFPDTLDTKGPNGIVNIRNPQFRYGFALNRNTTIFLSLEKPSSDVDFETARFLAQPTSPKPDGTIRLRNEFERGHIQVAAIFRSVSAALPSGITSSTFGWGVNTSMALETLGRDNLIVAAAFGRGISRYIQGTSGLGIDAEVASNLNPHLESTPALGLEAAYQHYWRKSLRSSLVYGYAAVQNTNFLPPAGVTFNPFNHGHYSALNLIWNPYGALHVGAEFLYGGQVLKDGSFAYSPRIQLSAKYSLVKTD